MSFTVIFDNQKTIGAQRYWLFRMWITNSNAYGMREFRPRYQGSTVTPTNSDASQTYGGGGQSGLWQDPGTGWSTIDTSTPAWLMYDFGSAVLVDSIVMKSRDDGYWAQAPALFDILTSTDGVVYRYKFTIKPATWSQNLTQTFTLP